MIRYTLLTMYVLFFCGYALKDWYRGLLGMLSLVAFMERKDMPEQMLGIPGLAPFNVLLMFVLLGYLIQRSRDRDNWRMPKDLKLCLFGMAALIVIGYMRFAGDMSGYIEYHLTVGESPDSKTVLFLENVVTTLKWFIPALFVLVGCKDERRTNETVIVLTVVLVILGIQIIRYVGFGVITDGEALQRRALRVIGRDIGFHRNQISLWMASGFWFIWLLMMESKQPLRKCALLASAGIEFLALIMTGSRGGLLSWAVCGFIFAWIRWRRLLVIGPLVVAIAIAFVPALQERVMLTFSAAEETGFDDDQNAEFAEASAGRTILWAYTWEKIVEAPLLGHGREAMVNTGITLELLQNYDLSMAAQHPHNAYLQLVLDNGVVALFIVDYFFLVLIRRAIKMIRYGTDYDRLVGGLGLSWLVTFMAAGLTAQSFYPNEGTIFLWCVAALVIRQGFPSKIVKSKKTSNVTNVKH